MDNKMEPINRRPAMRRFLLPFSVALGMVFVALLAGASVV